MVTRLLCVHWGVLVVAKAFLSGYYGDRVLWSMGFFTSFNIHKARIIKSDCLERNSTFLLNKMNGLCTFSNQCTNIKPVNTGQIAPFLHSIYTSESREGLFSRNSVLMSIPGV